MLRRLFAYMVYALPLALPAWALPVFRVDSIGPAGYTSSATAISANGAVVGNYQLPDGTYRAFLWQDGQATPLAMPAGAVHAWATAVYGSGQAGGYTDSLQSPQGVIWNNLGDPISTAGSYIKGLNSHGDAAGMAIGADGAGYAFITHNGEVTTLGQPAGGSWSSANAISASGAAAGTAMTANGSFTAFKASANGTVTLLSALGGVNSYAQAISDSGIVAGHAQTAGGSLQATTWRNGAATALGTLGGINSYAYAINAAGHVAGYSDLQGGGTAALLYDNGLLYNLNGLLAAGSGWELLAAYGINNRGQIVGMGLYNGREQAFLLTPQESGASAPSNVPEPGTLWLAGPSLLAWFALRAHRKRNRNTPG